MERGGITVSNIRNLGCCNNWYPYSIKVDGIWVRPIPTPENQEKIDKINRCNEFKHQLKEIKLGNCWYRYICPNCEISYEVDSSD